MYCILHTIHILYVHNAGIGTGRNILDPENAHALLLWFGSKVKRCQVSVCKERERDRDNLWTGLPESTLIILTQSENEIHVFVCKTQKKNYKNDI